MRISKSSVLFEVLGPPADACVLFSLLLWSSEGPRLFVPCDTVRRLCFDMLPLELCVDINEDYKNTERERE